MLKDILGTFRLMQFIQRFLMRRRDFREIKSQRQ